MSFNNKPFRTIMLAGASVFSLSSCVTAPEPLLTAESMLLAPYTANTTAFDVDAFFTAMPDWLDVRYGDATFDVATGAMVVSDLVFSPSGATTYGLRVERAEIWGGDADALSSLLSGADTATHQIFDRIALTGVRSEGLQWENGAQSASISVDKIVYDGLSGRHIALAARPGAEGPAHFLRQVAAIASGYSIDGAAYSNLFARFNESQGNEVTLSVAEGFVRGYDGGRTEFERVEGLSVTTRVADANAFREVAARLTDQSQEDPENKILQPWARKTIDEAVKNPIAFIAANGGGRSTRQDIGLIESRGADLSGALHWMAAWELPPITETELIDLGSMVMEGYSEAWDDQVIQSIERSELLSGDFYWLIPSDIQTRETGMFVDVMGAMDSMIAMTGAGTSADTGAQEIQQVREIITALGVETVRGDQGFDWRWDGATGELDTGIFIDALGLAATDFGISLDGPNLAAWDQMVRSDTPVTDLSSQISLVNMSFALTDETLLDRIFSYAAAEQGGTAEDMRNTAIMAIRMSAPGAAEMNARIPGYLEAIANFVETGGTLSVESTPAAPLPLDALQAASENAPQTIPDILSLEIVHTPQ